MDLGDIYRNTFMGDFNERLPQIKQTIIDYLKSNPTSIYIGKETNVLDDLGEKKRNPDYVPEFAKVDSEGLKLALLTDELMQLIMDNIPKEVQSLALPMPMLDKHPNLLANYQQLAKLTIPDWGWKVSTEELRNIVNGTNISEISAPRIAIEDIESLLNQNYISDGSSLSTKLDNINLTCKSNNYHPAINIVPPITDDIISMIPSDFFDEETRSFTVLMNGKKIIDKGYSSTKVLLNDDVNITKDLITRIIEHSKVKPKVLTIIAQNKTYENIESLKSLEDLCEISIEYGQIEHATIDQFDAMRATLDYYKGLILQNDLSPAERICYAYDLIKSNIYRECEENRTTARQIHHIVETGNIVCVGYAVFLAQLLKEVGVKAHAIGTSVPLDDGKTAGHQRNLVEIEDDKYGIHGMYAFDCTWDSNSDVYKVIREGEEKVVREPKENDEVVKKYDPMSRYSYFFIPADEYGMYFPGEKQFENVSEWNGKEYDPNEAALDEIPERSNQSTTEDTYTSTEEVSEDKLMEIIYNTRICEGYSFEINQELLEEVEEVRRLRAPKELRAEEGMTK